MIRWAGMEILEDFKEVVDPRHTALLLWNFSPRVIDGCFNRATILEKTKTLLDKARARGVRLIYSKPGPVDWNTVGAPMVRMRMKQMRVKHPSDLPKLQMETGFIHGLEPAAEDIIFDQFLPNAFLGTSFEWWLRKYQLKTLIVVGASLETGIDGTARDALNLGYYTVIVRDCVGSPFKDTYDAALQSLERIFDVVDSAAILREW
jgi:nicotinamidase-related amidase